MTSHKHAATIPVQRPYLGPEELAAVSRVFDSRWLGMGALTKEFEDRLSEFLGAKHVIAVNTGTSALHIALAAVGVGPADEVIVPSLTFAASVQAVLATGARPVFCDSRLDTLNMDVSDALSRITPRTKAIMPVHYGGAVCQMDELLALRREPKIWIVEDGAHAFGSSYNGRKVGTLGDVTCFSFDPIKNITCGEGGAVATADEGVASRLMTKRILGIDNDTWSRYHNKRNWFYSVTTPGFRYHMSDINAAIGIEQLKRFDTFRGRKQAIAESYDEALSDLPGLALIDRNTAETFPFFYIVRVLEGRRDELMAHLKGLDVSTGVHYIPNHLQPLFREFHRPLPGAERLFDEILTLPLYFEMSSEELTRVIEGVRGFFGK